MRKIITFLGTKPSETIYEWQGRAFPGKVFAEALREFVQFDKMLVLTTSTAAETTWPVLAALQDARIEKVSIPDGMNQAEMWGIFQVVIGQVDEGETVIFDITHGFRSLPFLAFLFAAYLKTAKKVEIEAIYYGAYEMASQNGGKAPVIDMSPFVNMLDWITATDQFVQTGNAKRLAELLNPLGNKKSKSAVEASRKLSSVSMAAFLCQPFELMQSARALETTLRNTDSAQDSGTQPFNVLREQIVGRFGQFHADYKVDARAAVCQEFRLLEWYYENGQLMQAITLSREWLIDAVTLRLNQPLDFAADPRKTKEWAVSGLARVGSPDEKLQRRFTFEDLTEDGKTIWNWPERELIKKVWIAIQFPRNSLDHAGHQNAPVSTVTIQKKARNEILPGLQELAKKWNLY